MAHFAEINENNVVVNVYNCGSEWDGLEDSLSSETGLRLKQTSYNTSAGIHYGTDRLPDGGKSFRGNYAGIGYTYNPDLDGFLPPQPDGWVLNPYSYSWEANWVVLPNGTYWLMIYKNASSSISSAILTQLFNTPTENFSDPNRKKLPMVGKPNGPVYAVIRDPIDRFLSAHSMGMGVFQGKTVSEAVDWVVGQDPRMIDFHFRPQTVMIGDVQGITYFDFAKDLSPLATALGLSGIPSLHVAPGVKQILTAEDTAKLKTYYAGDIALYQIIISQ